jgi:SAM-dependent methyltransferase
VLDYQPFILSDDIQTGAAHSWLFADDPRVSPKLVFRRQDCTPEQWRDANDANGRLRAMYDDLLDEVAIRFPGGTLLDIACNNGYFPVGAELRGMKGAGLDLGNRDASFAVLNGALGTKARFLPVGYDSRSHTLPVDERFDVTVMTAIMCHLPDPLHFLAAASAITNKAILFWGQVINTDSTIICYSKPHPNLSNLTDFPNCFNDNTRVSRGMFRESARLLGFSEVIQIPPQLTWISELCNDRDIDLESEFKNGSPHMALLLVR